MPNLVPALLAIAALCLFNFVVTLVLLSRMRVYNTRLAELGTMKNSDFEPGRLLSPGTVVPEFSATTSTGELVSRDSFSGPTLVAFFAPGCQPCEKLLPTFIEYAGAFPGGRDEVLAVLTFASAQESAGYAAQLEPVARVIVEDGIGPASEAFEANALPALYLAEAGGIIAAGGTDSRFFRAIEDLAVHA